MRYILALTLRLLAAVLVIWTSLANDGNWSRMSVGYALAAYMMLVANQADRER